VSIHWAFVLIPFFGLIVMVAAVAIFVVMVVRAATSPALPPPMPPAPLGPPSAGPQMAQPARETPLEILARRFASGDISADEYQKARDLLQGGSTPPAS
jgi:uncharacterized membrane protein